MRLEFDWDAIKALSNMRKHRVSFDEAMAIFLDPVALTIFDADHSDAEERWITVGRSKSDVLLLVVHTHVEVAEEQIGRAHV